MSELPRSAACRSWTDRTHRRQRSRVPPRHAVDRDQLEATAPDIHEEFVVYCRHVEDLWKRVPPPEERTGLQ